MQFPVISLKEAKSFMSGLRQFFEQSEMDEKKMRYSFQCYQLVRLYAMDQIVANNLSQKNNNNNFFNM